MILFDPAEGGDTGGGAAVADAPAVESAPVESIPTQAEVAPIEGKQEQNTPEKPVTQAETPKFRASIVEWAKEAGLTDEDLKDYGSEKALLRALKTMQEPAAPVQPVEKPVDAPKAPPVKQEQVEQTEQIDVNQIPDLSDDVHPEIVAVVGALKKAFLGIQAERSQEKAELQEWRQSQNEPIYDAFDEFFAEQKEFEDVFGKGDHRAPQALKEEQRAERAKVANLAMNLLRQSKLKPTAQNVKKMSDRALWSLHTDRRLGKIQAAAEQKVAVAQRRGQFIARARPAGAVTSNDKINGPSDDEIQENIRRLKQK